MKSTLTANTYSQRTGVEVHAIQPLRDPTGVITRDAPLGYYLFSVPALPRSCSLPESTLLQRSTLFPHAAFGKAYAIVRVHQHLCTQHAHFCCMRTGHRRAIPKNAKPRDTRARRMQSVRARIVSAPVLKFREIQIVANAACVCCQNRN